MIFFAFTCMSEMTAMEEQRVEWGTLLLATIIPACITLLSAEMGDNPLHLFLGISQGATMVLLLRSVLRFFRRRDYSDIAIGGIMSVAYFSSCLLSNSLWLLGIMLARRL